MRQHSTFLSRVTLFRGADAWMIDVCDDPTAGETLELFGGTILPLPYTLQASLDMVITRLLRQHPNVIIYFRDENTRTCVQIGQLACKRPAI